MSLVEKFTYTKTTRPLFHYTSIGALMGMAQSESIWATSILYLNDSKEMVQAYEVFEHALMPRLAFSKYSNEEKSFLEQLKKWISSTAKNESLLFVFSLSEEGNLLSQWRSYTPHGKGVNLQFSIDKINKLLASNKNTFLVKCIYDEAEQTDLIGNFIDELVIRFRINASKAFNPNRHISECYFDYINTFYNEVLFILASLKHEAFKEEKEWRLVTRLNGNFKSEELCFREGASMIAPYIKISLLEKPYFDFVTLGPSQHKDLSFKSLMMFTSKHGLCPTVVGNNTPYREW